MVPRGVQYIRTSHRTPKHCIRSTHIQPLPTISYITLRTTRQEIKKDVASAKEKWILSFCDHLNRGCIEKGGMSGIWTLINRIKASLSKVQKSNQTQMKILDEKECTLPAEMRKSFSIILHNSLTN